MECSICYDAINSTTGVATLSCSHSFHICCITGWFAKLEKGTCPCCRKEMSPLEDMPQAAEEEEEDEDEDDGDEEEVELSRAELDELLRTRGGQGLTDAMAMIICPDFAYFEAIELNALIVGNGGRHLNEEEWDRLVVYTEAQTEEREDEDDIAEAVASVWNELASYDVERSWLMVDGSWTSTILNPEEATDVAVAATPAAAASVATSAATKMQAAWRGFRGRLSMI